MSRHSIADQLQKIEYALRDIDSHLSVIARPIAEKINGEFTQHSIQIGTNRQNVWVDVPGTGFQTMVRSGDRVGTIYVRGTHSDEAPQEPDRRLGSYQGRLVPLGRQSQDGPRSSVSEAGESEEVSDEDFYSRGWQRIEGFPVVLNEVYQIGNYYYYASSDDIEAVRMRIRQTSLTQMPFFAPIIWRKRVE